MYVPPPDDFFKRGENTLLRNYTGTYFKKERMPF